MFKRYKRIFRLNLQPVFAVLLSKKKEMNEVEWVKMVEKTLSHVHNKPVEYLGQDLPHESLMTDILDELQREFFKEVHAFEAAEREIRHYKSDSAA